MDTLEHLFESNRAWAARTLQRDPDFFQSLAQQQAPAYVWIGCSDSRVPANEIMGRAPGEVFVHRNVGNVVVHTDLNCLSVLHYAVEVLKVRHVIVCGHYGCGGVRAAWQGTKLGLVDNWLRHVQDVANQHRAQLEGLDDEAAFRRLCELNVLSGVLNVSRTTVVQDAWARGQALNLHGLIYDLEDGLLRDLGYDCVGPNL
ncbi:carbonate dehydratase [soil metagenome]